MPTQTTPSTPTTNPDGGPYDAFTFTDPADTYDADGSLIDADSGNVGTIPVNQDYTGAQSQGCDTNGPIDVTSPPTLTKWSVSRMPQAGDYGQLIGTGFLGFLKTVAFQPKSTATLNGYGAPVSLPFVMEDDGLITFGPWPAGLPADLKGGRFVFTNHRGSAFMPVCDPSNVTGYSPTHAAVGATIHVLGTFGGPIDRVAFGGGVDGVNTHMSGDGTYVITTVPSGAVNGPLCVYADKTCTGADACAPASNPFVVDGAAQQPPFISGFFPDQGTGGTQVHITGQSFTGVDTVKFNGANGMNARSFTVNDDGDITCVVPDNAPSGPLYVHNAAGGATSQTSFTYGSGGGGGGGNPPIISSVTPNPLPQQVKFTVYGQGFVNLTEVKITTDNHGSWVLGTNQYSLQNGGTSMVIDGSETDTWPVDNYTIRITNVSGYDKHTFSVTKFNPKVNVTTKAPFWDSHNSVIVAPGLQIATSPAAGLIEVTGGLAIVGLAGLNLGLALGHRDDHYPTPPTEIATPTIPTPGVAMPVPHPYPHGNAGEVKVTWNHAGDNVISIQEWLMTKSKIQARALKDKYDPSDDAGVRFFVTGPKGQMGPDGSFTAEVNARCAVVSMAPGTVILLHAAVTGDLYYNGVYYQSCEFDMFGTEGSFCRDSMWGDVWVACVPDLADNLWEIRNAGAVVNYQNKYGQVIEQTFGPYPSIPGLNTKKFQTTILAEQDHYTGCSILPA